MSVHHNRVQPPHLVERPCRLCGAQAPALHNGVLEDHPLCDECRGRLKEEHRLARRQADQQWAAEQRAKYPRKPRPEHAPKAPGAPPPKEG